MKNWDELRTAYHVAKLGTVTAAADTLDIQRVTVIRHIDNLEAHLGVKLFQRHRRGYTPTDMGRDLLQVADTAELEFRQLEARAKGYNKLYGEFIITSMEAVTPILLPVIRSFQQQHPTLEIRYLISSNLFKLEYGQAHIAIRGGEKPTHPDYVVKPFFGTRLGVFAHRDYVSKHGKPDTPNDLKKHHIVLADKEAQFIKKTPIYQWLKNHTSQKNITFQSNSFSALKEAIQAGMGIGILMEHEAQTQPDLVKVYPTNPDWQVPNWLVTHGDLHRTVKVQRFLQLLNAEMAEMNE